MNKSLVLAAVIAAAALAACGKKAEVAAPAEPAAAAAVAPAMEAAALGVPSIAVSQEVLSGTMKFERNVELDYSITEKLLYV